MNIVMQMDGEFIDFIFIEIMQVCKLSCTIEQELFYFMWYTVGICSQNKLCRDLSLLIF
jgi:hypothetical protein